MALKLENKHVITIGMFDQEAHKQLIPKDEFLKVIFEDIVKYNLCATVLTEGIWGVYKHEDGSTVIEPSIRIEVAGVEYSKVEPMYAHLRKTFSQESLFYEKQVHEIELLFEEDLPEGV